MARVHRPEPGVERAVELAKADTDAQPLKPCLPPYSYGTPCYWAYWGAWRAIIASRGRDA